MSSVISKESLDSVTSYNIVIGLLSTLFFFVGHELYRIGQSWIIRIIIFSVVIYFGFKVLTPIGDYLVSDVFTQFVKEIVTE